MNCADVREWLRKDLDGAAEPSGDVAAHLESCAACRAEAGRMQALAAAARASMPRADVPADFATQVMAGIETPPGDAVLAEQARPRARRWAPVLLALLVLPFLPWWGSDPPVAGELHVERDGTWVAAADAGDDAVFGLARNGTAMVRGVRIVALRPALLRAGRPLELLGGEVVLETKEKAALKTAPADVVLRPRTLCVAALGEGEMGFRRMKKVTPALLVVTVLAGGATLVNAQGEAEIEAEERATARAGKAPVRDPAVIDAEIARITAMLEEANAVIRKLKRELAREGETPDRADATDEPFAGGSGEAAPARDPRRADVEAEALRRRVAELVADNVRKAAKLEALGRRQGGGTQPAPSPAVRVNRLVRTLEEQLQEVVATLERALVDAEELVGDQLAEARGLVEHLREDIKTREQTLALVRALATEFEAPAGPRASGPAGKPAGEFVRAKSADDYIRIVKDPRSTAQQRYDAVIQLGNYPRSKRSFRALLDTVADANAQDLVRRAAAWSLGRFGETARDAVPTLIECVADKEPYVGYMCHRALLEIAEATKGGAAVEFDPTWEQARRREAAVQWRQWWARANGVR